MYLHRRRLHEFLVNFSLMRPRADTPEEVKNVFATNGALRVLCTWYSDRVKLRCGIQDAEIRLVVTLTIVLNALQSSSSEPRPLRHNAAHVQVNSKLISKIVPFFRSKVIQLQNHDVPTVNHDQKRLYGINKLEAEGVPFWR